MDHDGTDKAPPARRYHHGDLRRVLLDAAERRLARGGPGAVSIRACARDAGVAPAAPLHHFGSLAGLLSALAARGFARLVARLDADAATGNGAARLVGAYVDFALEEPALFDLMWRDDLLAPDDPALGAARRTALERLRAVSATGDDPRAARLAAIRAWSLAHGLALLLRHGRIVSALGDPEAGLATAADFAALARTPGFAAPE